MRARNAFLIVLNEVRGRYRFEVVGYVVMPEHVHLLIGESTKANPSVIVQVMKQHVSRTTAASNSRGSLSAATAFSGEDADHLSQLLAKAVLRFQCLEPEEADRKLNYMHMNPVKRGWWQTRKYGRGWLPVLSDCRKEVVYAGRFEGLAGKRGRSPKHKRRNRKRNQHQHQHQHQHRKHPPFAKAAKDGAPAKTGAGIGRMVEWYHSRGSAVNCGDHGCKTRKGGPPASTWR